MTSSNRGHLLVRTPDSVPSGTCMRSYVETGLSWTWNIILDAPDIYKCSSFLLLYQYIYITTKLQLCYCCMVVTVLQSWIQYNKYGTLRSCIKVSLHVSVLKFCRGKGTIMKFWNWHITAATFKPQIRPIVDVGRVPPINIRVVVSSQNIIVAHFHD